LVPGGRIEATSTLGQGTRFDIVLPVPAVQADERDSQSR
jgi:signal transduction histidine kinase